SCPVYELLGGPHRKSFRAYCSILFGDTPAQTYELARRFAGQGFGAIKFGWGPMGLDAANDVALVREARRGAGEDVDILIDAGQAWDWKTALERARAFAEFRPVWLEEPLHPEDLSGYAQLCRASPVPIAAGEAQARFEEFEHLVVEGGLDWVQPDPGRCGISTMVQVGRLAARMHRKTANHSFKSSITMAASLHALAAVPGTELFEVVHGQVSVPEGVGLGVTIDEETLERFRVG
ncbi:MAG: mandelate racemase/muconate lactonizing enzyme family protein, partial [Gammaproteobacteria bacterium]